MKKRISLEKMTDSPRFSDASISFDNVTTGDKLEEGKFTFKMNVENYELGTQTTDAADKGLANSGKGQHIHFIMNI